MANARTAKKSKAKKKTTKKKATKVVRKKKKAAKKATKVVQKKTAASPHTKTPVVTLKTLWLEIQLLRCEVAELKELSGAHTPKTETLPMNTPDQPSLFDTPPTTNGETTFTKEEIAQALQEVMTVGGQGAVKDILTRYKAARVSELKEKDFPAVFDACKTITDAPTKAPDAGDSTTSIFG